jgi:hypothetical protein
MPPPPHIKHFSRYATGQWLHLAAHCTFWYDDSILPLYDTVSHPWRTESSATLLPQPQNSLLKEFKFSQQCRWRLKPSRIRRRATVLVFRNVCLSTDRYVRFHLLLCFSFTSRPTPSNILDSTVGQRDIQVFKLSIISCTFTVNAIQSGTNLNPIRPRFIGV